MIQCSDCELCERGPGGKLNLLCDPFSNIKEPECLMKWQLLKLNAVLHFHEQQERHQQRMSPMQEKLFRYMEHEIDEQGQSEQWRQSLDDDGTDY